MTHLLQRFSLSAWTRGATSALAVLALLAVTAFASPAVQAQIVFDDFDDGDVSDVFPFAGGADNTGAGVGPTEGFDGTPEAGLELGVDPGSGGGFAGAVVTGGDGVTVDVTDQSYFSFWVRPPAGSALPLTLEVNFQEDVNGDGMFDPAVEDEFQAVYRLSAGDGSYEFVQIPIASFTDDNTAGAGSDDGFEFENVLQVVYAFGGIPAGDPFTVGFDELEFTQEAATLAGDFEVFDDFDDGDVSDVFPFAGGADNTGAGVGPTEGFDGTPEAGLELGVDPGSGGGFAGAVVTGGDGVTVDVTDQSYFSFWVRPPAGSALPLTLEVNFQEDVNGDGMFDPAVEDEFQAVYRLSAGDGSYEFVQIPIASFTDDNTAGAGSDDGFEFENVLQVVYAFGGIPAGDPFTVGFDELGFTSGNPSTFSEPSGTTGALALSGAYPNPFAAQAQFKLTLERAESVTVEVFDVLGRQVDVLHEGTLAAQTPHTFEIDGRDLPSGMYFYRVSGETFSETRSLVLVK